MRKALFLYTFALAACASTTTDRAPGGDPSPASSDPEAPLLDAKPPSDPSRAPGEWIAVPIGTFTMSNAADACREENEVAHDVTITRAFEMTKTEVTRAQFQEVMGYDPSTDTTCGADCPVETITWGMAAAYCNALSERTGATACYTCGSAGKKVSCSERLDVPFATCLGYRLPSEAEWERAFRADEELAPYSGRITACTGEDPALVGTTWYRANAERKPHRVATKRPNAWGFHDLSGNVWEWTHDRFVPNLGTSPVTDPVQAKGEMDLRVMRGGSFNCEAYEVRGSHRSAIGQNVAGSNVGFRCARSRAGRTP